MLGTIQTTSSRAIGTGRDGSSGSRATIRRGFSLIEIMIVMIILITLIAIFVPVLAGARNASRKFATQQLFTGLQTSSSQFELDQRRLPGYFSQVNMGSAENATRGFTQMQNLLLDLSGGVVANVTTPGGNRINVGPTAAGTATVDLNLVNAPAESKGVVKNVYFNIDKKNWISQSAAGQKVAVGAHITLPDIVDAWSNPVLAWAEDESAGASAPFAAESSATRAKFYWNSNAAFLKATEMGRGAQNQLTDSMLSTDTFNYDTVVKFTMHGLLGHPGFPASPITDLPTPASSRSKIVFHSAGNDGIFLGLKDRGGLLATAPGTPTHRLKVVDYKGSKGDPLDNFDDVVAVGGN